MHKMNNQHFEKPLFAPKMSLLWVYFSLPIKQLLPALRGVFCTSQSLWLGGLPDAHALCRATRECQGGEWRHLSNRKGIKVLLSLGGQGVAVTSTWKNENKYGTDADKFQPLWKQLDAVERASDLELKQHVLKPQMCHFWVL